MKRHLMPLFVLTVFCFAALAGCAHHQMSKTSSSVPLSSYIKSVSDSRQIDKKTPLNLPASVSILFIPGNLGYWGVPYTTLHKAAEELKKQLLANPKYIGSVSIIQADEASGRISLSDIKSSYTTDIVVILSFQQSQKNNQIGLAGLLDITIVGMFVFPGVETNTTTLIDAKVVHIPNNALIFRTSAIDDHSTYSTSYGERSTAAEESIKGIMAATAKIGDALTKTLTKFENYDMSQAVPMTTLHSSESGNKQSNDYWKKVDNYKSSGGGTFGFIPLLIALAAGFLVWRRK
ncbi:MAG: rhombotarget lipoprotein [Smithella sp.]